MNPGKTRRDKTRPGMTNPDEPSQGGAQTRRCPLVLENTVGKLIQSQHWFRQWLGAVWQQAIARTNVHPDLCRHMESQEASVLTTCSNNCNNYRKLVGLWECSRPGTRSPYDQLKPGQHDRHTSVTHYGGFDALGCQIL